MEKEVFVCSAPWRSDRLAKTLMIQCSGYDIRPYHFQFVTDHLGLVEYDLLALPGGVQLLSLTHLLPKVRGFFYRVVEFLIKHHNLTKIIILGHEDCAWYKDFRFGLIHLDLKERQFNDLKVTASALHQNLGVAVEAYFANLKDGKVVYTQVV